MHQSMTTFGDNNQQLTDLGTTYNYDPAGRLASTQATGQQATHYKYLTVADPALAHLNLTTHHADTKQLQMTFTPDRKTQVVETDALGRTVHTGTWNTVYIATDTGETIDHARHDGWTSTTTDYNNMHQPIRQWSGYSIDSSDEVNDYAELDRWEYGISNGYWGVTDRFSSQINGASKKVTRTGYQYACNGLISREDVYLLHSADQSLADGLHLNTKKVEYDSAGRLATIDYAGDTNLDGSKNFTEQSIYADYNDFGRPCRLSHSTTDLNKGRRFESHVANQLTYNGNGQVVNDRVAYKYRLAETESWYEDQWQTQYVYDQGRLQSTRYPISGKWVGSRFAINPSLAGRVEETRFDGALVESIDYDGLYRIDQRQFKAGDMVGSGYDLKYEYTPDGRLSELHATQADNDQIYYDYHRYEYDAVGRMASHAGLISSTAVKQSMLAIDVRVLQNVSYDSYDRPLVVSSDSDPVGSKYAYDSFGNIKVELSRSIDEATGDLAHTARASALQTQLWSDTDAQGRVSRLWIEQVGKKRIPGGHYERVTQATGDQVYQLFDGLGRQVSEIREDVDSNQQAYVVQHRSMICDTTGRALEHWIKTFHADAQVERIEDYIYSAADGRLIGRLVNQTGSGSVDFSKMTFALTDGEGSITGLMEYADGKWQLTARMIYDGMGWLTGGDGKIPSQVADGSWLYLYHGKRAVYDTMIDHKQGAADNTPMTIDLGHQTWLAACYADGSGAVYDTIHQQTLKQGSLDKLSYVGVTAMLAMDDHSDWTLSDYANSFWTEYGGKLITGSMLVVGGTSVMALTGWTGAGLALGASITTVGYGLLMDEAGTHIATNSAPDSWSHFAGTSMQNTGSIMFYSGMVGVAISGGIFASSATGWVAAGMTSGLVAIDGYDLWSDVYDLVAHHQTMPSWQAALIVGGMVIDVAGGDAVSDAARAARKLRAKRLRKIRNAGYQRHHIISHTNKHTKNHELLELADFKLKSKENMIFLPKNAEVNLNSTRSLHNGRHWDAVSKNLERKMNDAVRIGKKNNWSKEQYRERFLKIIKDEKSALRSGHRKLNKHHRSWAIDE